jgi:DNA repair exonuclease SbcCD nuclease subunit
MKLIHTADLHLDSAMDSRLPGEAARRRRQELLLTFGRIADLAVSEGVRAVLIAGDLFDTEHPSPSALRYVLDTVGSHPTVDFLVLYGNHAGSFRFGEDIPENLKLFGENAYSGYRYGNLAIYGCENPQAPLPRLSPDECNIVMLHGQISEAGRTKNDVTLSALRDRGIDYLALGHFHSLSSERLDERGIYCYSGCPEGRGFDETGDKGVVLLSEENGKLSRSTLAVARRRFLTVEVDITDCPTQRRIEEAVLAATEGIPGEDCVRVALVGTREAGLIPGLAQCRAALDSRFFYSEVRDQTVFSLSPESYEHDLSLRGEFVRTVLRQDLDPELSDLILSAGLTALDGEEVSL